MWNGSSHSKEYDNCGRLAKRDNELGAVTVYAYDAARQSGIKIRWQWKNLDIPR